jgi:hypothetical protein
MSYGDKSHNGGISGEAQVFEIITTRKEAYRAKPKKSDF